MVKERCGWEEGFELDNVFAKVKGTFQRLRARQGQLMKYSTITMIIVEILDEHFGPFIISVFYYLSILLSQCFSVTGS